MAVVLYFLAQTPYSCLPISTATSYKLAGVGASAFVDKVEELIEQLKTGNIIFKPTNRQDIYHVVVVKQITLFYEVQADTITLLRFWNNYQDPQKLTL